MDWHLLPGFFSDAADRVLGHLAAGTGEQVGAGRGRGLLEWRGEPDPEFGEVEPGGARSWEGVVRLLAPPGRLPAVLEVFGGHPPGRRLVGLRVTLPPDGPPNAKDAEVALLSLGCLALALDDQGLVALGTQLGPVGAGVPRGTVAEQAQSLLELHGEALEVLLLPAGTEAALGAPEGFDRTPLGDLGCWRRRPILGSPEP